MNMEWKSRDVVEPRNTLGPGLANVSDSVGFFS